jgi:predicted transcriptional regulator
MLVKKINSEWFPSEKPDLKVGETIEITDAKALIVSGDVVGIGKHGEELSAYDLYGIMVKNEVEEFEEYKKMKRAQALKERLEKEQKELQAQANALEKATQKPVEKTTDTAKKDTKKK